MSATAAHLARVLARDVEGFRRELALFPDEASVWATRPGVTNSAGTLALHVAGNLKYFVGAVLGGTGYVRDRDAEFGRRDVPRAELDRELAETIAVVRRTLPGVSSDTLAAPYPKAPQQIQVATELFLFHLVAHLAFHLGQAGYLRRLVTGDNRSAGPVPVQGLVADG